MAWDIRQLYYYLVCFATLLMVIIGTVQAVRTTLDLVLPTDIYRPSTLEVYERLRREREATGEIEPALTREELEQIAEEESARYRENQQRSAIRRLLGNIALILIAAPVYVYHWRQVRRYEKSG